MDESDDKYIVRLHGELADMGLARPRHPIREVIQTLELCRHLLAEKNVGLPEELDVRLAHLVIVEKNIEIAYEELLGISLREPPDDDNRLTVHEGPFFMPEPRYPLTDVKKTVALCRALLKAHGTLADDELETRVKHLDMFERNVEFIYKEVSGK